MTWQELIDKIPKEQLNNDAVAYDDVEDEYHPITGTDICSDGILDDDNFFIFY